MWSSVVKVITYMGPSYMELFYECYVIDGLEFYKPLERKPDKLTWEIVDQLIEDIKINNKRIYRSFAASCARRTKARPQGLREGDKGQVQYPWY